MQIYRFYFEETFFFVFLQAKIYIFCFVEFVLTQLLQHKIRNRFKKYK